MQPASELTHHALLQHEAFVLRLARRLVATSHEAEEVAQRTFTSALTQPPRHSGVRAWLVRVTRNHALDLHRSERRRAARERIVARAEAQTAPRSSMEQLELSSEVVRAVLSLEEPYKGTVIAIHYEELDPSECARRCGVPAGTVRARLSRAHELLRTKLDRTRGGERGGWMSGLAVLVASRDTPAAAVLPAWLPWTGGVAATALVAGTVWWRTSNATSADATAVATLSPSASAVITSAPVAAASVATASAREPAALAQSPTAASPGAFEPPSEPEQMLQLSQQIKRLLLERRLAIRPDDKERFAWLENVPDSGIVTLCERGTRFGESLGLPGMRGGAAYYSFTERVHDYDRRPQIGYEQGSLGASFYGGTSALLLDLGVRELRDIPDRADARPNRLDPIELACWDIAWAPLVDEDGTPRPSLSMQVHSVLVDARDKGRLDRSDYRLASSGRLERAPAKAGRSFLLRVVSDREYDVLVAFEVVRASDDACTLAWRILRRWTGADAERVRPGRKPSNSDLELDAIWQSLSDDELLARLDAVHDRAQRTLFDSFAPAIEARFGTLREQPDAGLVRLIPHHSEWGGLSRSRLGNAYYSIADRTYDHGNWDIYVEAANRPWQFVAAGTCAALLPLGTIELDSVTTEQVERTAGELGAFVARHAMRHTTLASVAAPNEADTRSAVMAADARESTAFKERLGALKGSDRAALGIGQTYALRSVHFGSHDILAALHVAGTDEQGVVLAWRLLKSWPVEKRD